jgi:CRISPR-associated protein Csd1
MILKELADLARREGLVEDPDFEPKEVRWIISIGPGGRFLGETETQGLADARGKVRPKVMQVPRSPVRTSKSVANFLVDKAEYVLGFDPVDDPKRRPKLAHRRQLFREYIEAGLALASGDPGLAALLDFLREDAEIAKAIDRVRGRVATNDLFAFNFSGTGGSSLIHDRDAVRAAWMALRHPRVGDEVDRSECLVCGQASIPITVHPQVKHVPGGTTSGIAIVSANAPAFESLGLSGHQNASVCRACADAYGTALNRLFHPQYTAPDGQALDRRSFRLSADTAVIYWASGAAEHGFVNELGDLDFQDAARARALFGAVHAGHGVLLDDPTPFHALIVTGGQGRATLRSYYRSTVGDVAEKLRRYFADIDIVPRFPNAPRWPALSWLVRALAAQGKFENVDPDLAGRLFLAILSGSPFPAAVLRAAVARIRAEPEDPGRGQHKHTRERLALIRATLNRWHRAGDPRITPLIDEEIPAVLDETCTNNAYCLGRLFAVLEKLQGEAIGKPNATITDRFYGTASATPAAVFGSLIRKAQHHLAKVGGTFYVQKIQDVLRHLDPRDAFPTTLGLADQGLFALGYYHQRADLWTKKAGNPPADPDA